MTLVDERFPRWMAAIELEPTTSRRSSALRAAAESIGSSLDPHTAFALVEYAVGLSHGDVFDTVADAVAANDGSFTAAAADLEPRLVASAALACALERLDDAAAVVAGALLSAQFAGLSSPVEELPELARAALAGRFQQLRSRVPPPRGESVPSEPDAGEPTRSAQASADGLLESLTRRIAALEQHFGTRIDATNEELDLLWWAQAAQPSDERLRWGDPVSVAAVLRTGRELADRHRFGGEIPSALQLARRALGALAEEDFALADVVPAGAEHVAVHGLAGEPLLPVLTCAAACLAAGAESPDFSFEIAGDWVADARSHGVDPSMTRRGDEIATQTLRELLLARALDDG
jgi:hypothetical protein